MVHAASPAIHLSIPPEEQPFFDAALPGAMHTGPGEAWPTGPGIRLVSVMIHDDVTPDRLAALPDLEAVVTRSDGTDHLPLDWMARHDIDAYHLEGYSTDSVAQLALAHLLVLCRRLPEAHRRTSTGSWDRSGLVGQHLSDLVVGIVGLGRIGSALVHMLSGLGVRTIGHDIADVPLQAPGFEHAQDLETLLEQADAVSLHVPLTPQTQGMLDRERLAKLPPGAFVVNTARGALVDSQAMADALDGHLSGYAADVMPGEPTPDLGPFQGRDVCITPHVGAHNQGTILRRYEVTREITEAVLAGARPAHYLVTS